MRSPQIIAISIFASAASPALVSAIPTPPQSPNLSTVETFTTVHGGSDPPTVALQQIPRNVHTLSEPPVVIPSIQSKRLYELRSDEEDLDRRSYDWATAGGNAYSGATSSSSGGDIINDSTDDNTINTNNGGSECGYKLIPR